jgi:hypothetical protein
MAALWITVAVIVVILIVVAVLLVRRRKARKLDERRRIASEHRDMASMSHFEAERDAAQAQERAARARREQLEGGNSGEERAL